MVSDNNRKCNIYNISLFMSYKMVRRDFPYSTLQNFLMNPVLCSITDYGKDHWRIVILISQLINLIQPYTTFAWWKSITRTFSNILSTNNKATTWTSGIYHETKQLVVQKLLTWPGSEHFTKLKTTVIYRNRQRRTGLKPSCFAFFLVEVFTRPDTHILSQTCLSTKVQPV